MLSQDLTPFLLRCISTLFMGFLTTIDLSDSLPPVLGFVKHFPKTAIVGQQWPATGPRKPVCPEFRTKDIRTCTRSTTPENRQQAH